MLAVIVDFIVQKNIVADFQQPKLSLFFSE